MTDSAANRSLRFALLCDGESLQRWQLECLERLQTAPVNAVPVLLLRACEDTTVPAHPALAKAAYPGWLARRLWEPPSRQGQRQAMKLDARWAALPRAELGIATATGTAPGTGAAPGAAPSVQLQAEHLQSARGQSLDVAACSDGTLEPVAAALRRHEVDFILCFVDAALASTAVARLSGQVPYGVWGYHFGPWQGVFDTRMPGFEEVRRGASVSGGSLRCLKYGEPSPHGRPPPSDGAAGVAGEVGSTPTVYTAAAPNVLLLREGHLRTKRLSYVHNREHLLSRCTHWPAQVCVDIAQGAADYFSPKRSAARVPQTRPLEPSKARFGREPGTVNSAQGDESPAHLSRKSRRVGTWDVLAYGVQVLRYGTAAAMNTLLRHDHWNVGIVQQPIGDFLDPAKQRPAVQWLPARSRREFIADPFGIVRGGRLTVICEYLDYRDNLGVIVAADTHEEGGRTLPVAIGPQPPVHLSFPFLFEDEGRLLCIPETHQAREVTLWGVEKFPDRWTKLATLLADTALVDVTVFRHGGRWWLAGADTGIRSPSADLFLWYADAVAGPWQAHPGNPVKTDVRSARPAGTPFFVDGVLYRPTMDCSETYGGRVCINRVHTLTPTAFSEETVAVIEPDPIGPYPDGLHTLSAVGDITLIDSKRSVFVAAEFCRIVAGALRLGRKR